MRTFAAFLLCAIASSAVGDDALQTAITELRNEEAKQLAMYKAAHFAYVKPPRAEERSLQKRINELIDKMQASVPRAIPRSEEAWIEAAKEHGRIQNEKTALLKDMRLGSDKQTAWEAKERRHVIEQRIHELQVIKIANRPFTTEEDEQAMLKRRQCLYNEMAALDARRDLMQKAQDLIKSEIRKGSGSYDEGDLQDEIERIATLNDLMTQIRKELNETTPDPAHFKL